MFDVQKKTQKNNTNKKNNKRGKQSHSAGMQESKWGDGDRGAKQASSQPNMQPHKQPTKR